MSDDVQNLQITNRLLTEEAQRRGWKVEIFETTERDISAFLRAEKDGKEFTYASTATMLTSVCGYYVAIDKYLTYQILDRAGISVPDFVMIPGETNDFSEALKLLDKCKCVIVKPTCANHGDGITMNIRTKEDLENAVVFAREATKRYNSDAILVQEQVEGKEYRFLVVNGRCVAVANRRPAFVVGDGSRTIRELIEEKNLNPLRGEGHDKPLTIINLDEVVQLNGEAFLDYIPHSGQEVEVLKTSNLSHGGEAVNCTDIASSELKNLAEMAAARCQLEIAGVDIITTNIRGGGKNYIIEVNAAPGIRMHVYPSVGEPIDVAKDIIDVLERHAHSVEHSPRTVIGRSEYIESPLFGEGVKVPARIDTGARVASIWASNITMSEDGRLRFCLFDKQSDFYTGKVYETDEYRISVVRNSTGHEEMRFRVKIPIVLAGKKINGSFTLSDRSVNSFPILIGRNIINKKFTVDVAQSKCVNNGEVTRIETDKRNNEELGNNPYEFYKKYANRIVGVKKQDD